MGAKNTRKRTCATWLTSSRSPIAEWARRPCREVIYSASPQRDLRFATGAQAIPIQAATRRQNDVSLCNGAEV